MTLPTIAAQMASDIDIFYAAGMPGVAPAEYREAGEFAVDCTVRLRRGAGPQGDGADDYAPQARIRVRVSELADVSSGSVFAIGDDEWEILGAELAPSALEWLCDVNKR